MMTFIDHSTPAFLNCRKILFFIKNHYLLQDIEFFLRGYPVLDQVSCLNQTQANNPNLTQFYKK